MADRGDVRALLELERRVGAELVARGLVAQAALGPLLAEGRARGLARGGSFLAGAVLARRLTTPDVIDAALRGAELEPGEGTLTLAAPSPDQGERTVTMTGPALPLPPASGATAWGGAAAEGATAWGATAWGDEGPPAAAGPRADVTRLSIDAEVARTRAPAPRADRTFAPDLEEGVTAADVPTDGRTWMPFDGGSATSPGPPGRVPAAPAPRPVRYALPDGLAEGAQRAVDQQLAREVTLHAGAPGEAEQVQRAARALARLDHPGVPRVHDVGELEGRPYYTTDRLSGAPLGAGEARPLPALLRAFLDVGAAVAHAHRAGVVHGSLAPERVVLGAAGEVWVTGWGEAHGAAPDDDVEGLGRVLEGVLQAGRVRPPRALLAVTRAAADDAYDGAEALVEDVRRFLDGEGVSADSESLPRLLLRLARRHPAPAGVIGAILLALAAIGAVAASGLSAAWLAAKRARDQAATAITEAARQSEAARASARAAQESAEAAGARLRLEDALALALDASVRFDEPAPVVSAFAAAERLAEGISGPDRTEALARVRARRARWALDASRPAAALADVAAAADHDGLLLRFLAARRSPGPDADAAAAAALAALAAGEGPVAVVAQVLVALPALEEERARLDVRAVPGAPADASALVPRAKELVARLEAALVDEPGLALAHEALGRALVVAPDPLRGCREFVVATQLDPADPEPRMRMVEAWQRDYGFHDRRRWIAGWWRRQLASATKLTERPEPLMALTRLDVSQHARPRALRSAERILDLLRPGGPEAAIRDEAELFAARARLELGRDPGPALSRLRPGPGVDAARLRALQAWALLRAGAHEDGLRAAHAALSSLWTVDQEPLRDLVEAVAASTPPLADDEWAPLHEALRRSRLGEGEKEWAEYWLILAQGRAMSLRGVYSHLDVLQEAFPPGSFLAAEAQLAEARVELLSGFPARAHLAALLAWAQAGVDQDDLSTTGRDAQALLVRRLREAGRAEVAARFEQLRVDESTTQRAWSP